MHGFKDLGLSTKEAEIKQKKFGFNELPSAKPKTIWQIAFNVFREPMLLLLIVCGSLYFFLGEISEGILMLIFVAVITIISLVQESKTEKSLEALKNMSSPIAKVFRDGVIKNIPGRELVVGDIISVSEGDRIPADAILLYDNNLGVDESLLTGESLSVSKKAVKDFDINKLPEIQKPGGDNNYSLFSGTLTTRGLGFAKVMSIGVDSAMGQIGKSLNEVKEEKTLLQIEIKRVIKYFVIVGLSLCSLLTIIYGIQHQDWVEAALAGITLAMGTLPEEFPIVLSIFMAMGAWRLAQKRVLSRKSATIETLGSATVLCVDKTGTITQNKMSIASYFIPGLGIKNSEDVLSERYKELIRIGALACEIDAFDPMELAFFEASLKHIGDINEIRKNRKLIKEYEFTQSALTVTHIWQNQQGDIEICAKGAPEAVLDLCKVDKETEKNLKEQIKMLAEKGLRVLAIATSKDRHLHVNNLPESRDNINYELLGFIGLADPVRPKIKSAVEECYKAGIRVVMITGDYPVTAQNIASQIGLISEGGVITGEEIEKIGKSELNQRIKNVNIFSRVVPTQKLLLVNAFKEQGEVVAMTGDGVNDAPALKSAHIGIAMGKRGTDVAREASSMVLTEDNFSSIVNGVKIGRRIYDNLRKAMTYIFAVHIPIAGLSLLPVFFGWPLILMPVHIILLEMVIDPSCTIAFEAEKAEPNCMTRPPRKLKDNLFNRNMILISLLQGLSVLILLAAIYAISIQLGFGAEKSRAITYIAMIASNVSLIWSNRSWSQSIIGRNKEANNKTVVLITILVLIALVLINYLPFLNSLFGFSQLSIIELLISIFLGFIMVIWFEIMKVLKLIKI